jgi:4-amino-4-deoxy-L-arabinose transferase-like glycosyltransferase
MFKRPVIEFTTAPPKVINIPGWSLILLFLAYILPGNIGHAPWRGDDVLYIATTASMLHSGDWLVPRIAGIAFLDSPPLHYWLGSLTGMLLGWLLPLHDAIRLASVAVLAFSLWALREAAKRLIQGDGLDNTSGNATVLLALSSMGLLIHAHEAQPMITLFAGTAGTLWGLSILDDRPRRGMLLVGGFIGAAFLAGGLPGLVLTLPACVVALIVSRPENPVPTRYVIFGALLALVFIAVWPICLALRNPNLLMQWWQQELFDIAPALSWKRISAFSGLLSWFAWPLWPVAGWALWRHRRAIGTTSYAVPLVALSCALWIIVTTGTVRPANALPILPPLILLAGPEVVRLRKGASNLLDWFGIMTFTLLGTFLWLSWTALHVGRPAGLARNISRLTPDFAPHISWWAIPVAVLLSLGWFIALARVPRFPLRGVLRWALGVTLTWGLATTLWLDWFDYDKNYARITTQISEQVHDSSTPCVMEIGAGDVQRAALDYFSNIRLQRFSPSNTRCSLVLSYRAGQNALAQPGDGWSLQWNESKGRGRLREQFALFRRK